MEGAGTYLRKLRLKHGMSLDDIVERSRGQIDKTTLSRTENNQRRVSLKMAFLLSEIYGEPFEPFARKIMKLQGLKPRGKQPFVKRRVGSSAPSGVPFLGFWIPTMPRRS